MEHIQNLIETTGQIPVIGIYSIPMIANLFPGIPEEVFLLGVGYLSGQGVISFWNAYLVFFIGFFIVDLIVFCVSRRGVTFAKRMKKKISNKGIKLNDERINRNYKTIIFVSRFIPFLRWIGPVLSGLAHVPHKKFMKMNAIALLVYIPFVLLLGRIFHDQIDSILQGFTDAGNLIGPIIIIVVLVLIATVGRHHFLDLIRRITKDRKNQI